MVSISGLVINNLNHRLLFPDTPVRYIINNYRSIMFKFSVLHVIGNEGTDQLQVHIKIF